MAWTTPTTVSAGDKLTSTMWNNQVAGNLSYLLSPNKGMIIRNNNGDYSTTSTSWVDVDATNLSITITTYGGPVLVLAAMLTGQTSGDTGGIDVTMDGTRIGEASTLGLVNATSTYVPICTIVTPAAGSHTFKLQYRTTNASYATIIRSNTYEVVTFAAIEL